MINGIGCPSRRVHRGPGTGQGQKCHRTGEAFVQIDGNLLLDKFGRPVYAKAWGWGKLGVSKEQEGDILLKVWATAGKTDQEAFFWGEQQKRSMPT